MENTIKQVIEAQPVSVWQIESGGPGQYGTRRDGDKIAILRKSGRAFLLRDSWAGGNVEGYCYRLHFCEVKINAAIEVIEAAARASGGRAFPDAEIRRFANAPIWLKTAIKAASVRDASGDPELNAAVAHEEIGAV